MNETYFAGWILSRILFRAVFRARIYHPERVPSTGPVILAANHASMLDPLLIGCGLPRDIHYLARESLFRFPFCGSLLRRLNCVPVDREGGGARGLKAILGRLLDGHGILLFPEGTRTPDGRLQPARSGVGLVVLRSNAPVIPVRVFGTFEAWGRHQRWPRPRPVAVTYGHPLRFEAEQRQSRGCSKARLKGVYQGVADTLMTAIARLEPCRDKTSFP